MGRIDDVINVSGHWLGTMEVESALVSHPAVVEAAVVGMPHEIKGTGVAAFVTLEQGHDPGDGLRKDLLKHVANEIGAIAAGTDSNQDTTTLEDFSVMARLRESDEG